jgi:hypothetical protein
MAMLGFWLFIIALMFQDEIRIYLTKNKPEEKSGGNEKTDNSLES